MTLGHAASLGNWVLFIGPGGLSHKPPVPQMATTTTQMAKRLIDGPNPDKAAVAARINRMIATARRLTEAIHRSSR